MCRSIREHIVHNEPHGGDVVQTLQAKPQYLSARLTVSFATEKTTQSGDPVNGLS